MYGVKCVGIAEDAVACVQVVDLVVDLIADAAFHNESEFDLRVPVPGERAALVSGENFLIYKNRKCIVSVWF